MRIVETAVEVLLANLNPGGNRREYFPDRPASGDRLTPARCRFSFPGVIGRILLLSALGVTSLSAAVSEIPFASDIPPSFSHSEIYQEFGNLDCDEFVRAQQSLVPKVEPVRINLELSMTGIDPATLTPETSFSIDFGSLVIDGKLGEDPQFVVGKTKAKVNLETDYGQPLPGGTDYGIGGSIEFDWSNGSTLKVVVRILNGTSDYFPVAANFTDTVMADDTETHVGPEPIDPDTVEFTFTFGNRVLLRDVYFEGTAQADYHSGRDECETSLDRIEITGKISQPAVQIDTPSEGAEVRVPYPTLEGFASNSLEFDVTDVTVSANGQDPEFATVTPVVEPDATSLKWKWSLSSVKLSPGRNVITAISYDGSNFNEADSAPVTRVIYYPTESTVTVNRVGEGSLSGGFPGSATFATASTASIDAIPKPGWLFTGWSGSVNSTAPRLRFEVVPDMVLTATFVEGPFMERMGVYHGGGAFDAGLSAGQAALKLNLSILGTVTGQLLIGGERLAIRGSFARDGIFTQRIRRPGRPDVTVRLVLDLAQPAAPILVEIGCGTDTGTFQASRLGTTGGGGVEGVYTVSLLRNDDPRYSGAAFPAGNGFAHLKITSRGDAMITGKLPDATRFSGTGKLAGNGDLFLFVTPYRNEGLFCGNLMFRDQPGISDADGLVDWVRPEGRRYGPTYVAGFAMQTPVIASRFSHTPGARVFPNNAPQGTVMADDADENLFAKPVGISEQSKISVPNDGHRLQLNIVSRTGLFNGSFVRPEGTLRRFSGAVLQKPNSGFGCFVDGTQTGSIKLVSEAPD